MIKKQTDRQQSGTCRLVLMENPHEGPVAVKSAVAVLALAQFARPVCLYLTSARLASLSLVWRHGLVLVLLTT